MCLKRIVVIGGTGHFGGRICRRIVGEPNTELVVTSRSQARAQAIVDELQASNPTALSSAARLDQLSADFETDLLALHPDIVIHTAGPYQGQDYRVAKACIQAGSHYVDLADGRDFVQGFDSLDDAAKRDDLLLVSGASTLPGLSSVVVDSQRREFRAINRIEISIAPAHQTPRGKSTIAAVLSYCGIPFEVLVDGEWVTKFGWQDIRRHRYPSFGMRMSGACDVPDLGLLPIYVDGVDTVTFHAALEAKWEQLALWNMGWLTRAGIIKKWDRFIPMFQNISDRLIGLGSDVGGMHISISGTSIDNKPKSVTWNLLARQNHGPEIPCTPALILVRKLAADSISTRGALPCLGMFSMTDFENELSDFDVRWDICES
jgi:saccharopine dehydrogenase-like NADP-dependent oxidoreductase